jgi:hypothetical protein
LVSGKFFVRAGLGFRIAIDRNQSKSIRIGFKSGPIGFRSGSDRVQALGKSMAEPNGISNGQWAMGKPNGELIDENID